MEPNETEGELKFGDESEMAARLRKVLGVGPYEQVHVRMPQFGRIDGREIVHYPETEEDWKQLPTLPRIALVELGLQQWDPGHWLYPGEWYEHIPTGHPIVDICGDKELFVPGQTDDDRRFGALAYGFKREEQEDELAWFCQSRSINVPDDYCGKPAVDRGKFCKAHTCVFGTCRDEATAIYPLLPGEPGFCATHHVPQYTRNWGVDQS